MQVLPLDIVLIACESLFRRQAPVKTVRRPKDGLFLPGQVDLVQFLFEALVVVDLLLQLLNGRRNQLPPHPVVLRRLLRL